MAITVLAIVLIANLMLSSGFLNVPKHQLSTRVFADSDKSSFFDFLSGKKAIESAKKANPQLFESRAKSSTKAASKQSVKFTESTLAAIKLYKDKNPKPLPNSSWNIDDNTLGFRFNSLTKILGDEAIALKAVTNYPDVLVCDADKCKQILDVFSDKWGREKAIGVVVRNPSLFNVPVSGYGSAEAAAEETIYVSYLIDITRPIGKPLLALLFAALLKPVFVSILDLVQQTSVSSQ